jgi:signal transduction histidine kinase
MVLRSEYSRLILLALGVLVVYQVLCIVSISRLMVQPSGGWVFWETWSGELTVRPATTGALAVTSKQTGPLQLLEVNGQRVDKGHGPARVRAMVDTRPGARNTYLLSGAKGQRVSATLPVERPTPNAFGEGEADGILSILYHLLGLVFLLVGLRQWWRRPADRASRSLLLFCMVEAFYMAEVYPHDQLSVLLLCVNSLFFPFLAPAGFYLAVAFTHQQDSPLFRSAVRVFLAGAAVLGAALVVGTYLGFSGLDSFVRLQEIAYAATGVSVVAAILFSFYACWRAAHGSSSLIQGVRGREMAKALLVPFIVPTLWQVFRSSVSSPELIVAIECVQLASLAAFPVMVGHAITITELIDRLHRAQSRLLDSELQSMLTRFIAGIVHEINSPLGVLTSGANTIRSAVENVERGIGDERAPKDKAARRMQRSIKISCETAQTMEAASKRISSLLSNLKRSISLDAAEYRTLDLREGLEDALKLLAPGHEDRVTFTRHYQEGDVVLSCYPARLHRVLICLLQNAIDAIDGRGEVRISMESYTEDLQLEIADSGRGIPVEELATIFDFGFTKGTGRIRLGMGLPSSKRLVQQMGGDIDVRSTEGQGTTVRLTVPRTCERDQGSGCGLTAEARH